MMIVCMRLFVRVSVVCPCLYACLFVHFCVFVFMLFPRSAAGAGYQSRGAQISRVLEDLDGLEIREAVSVFTHPVFFLLCDHRLTPGSAKCCSVASLFEQVRAMSNGDEPKTKKISKGYRSKHDLLQLLAA